MGNASSKAKTNPVVTSQDEAVLKMKIQRDNLEKYRKRIGTVLNRELEIARECLAKGDRKRAALALRKKKYQEQLLDQTDQHLDKLQDLIQNVEFVQVQKDVLLGLEQGNKVLKEINKEMTIERVEKIMDDSAEGIAYQQEISDMLANNISSSDELEVQEELEALEKEELAKKIPVMPDVPKVSPISAEPKNEEEELREEPSEKLQAIPA